MVGYLFGDPLHILSGLAHATGIDRNGQGPEYGWWSGSGSDLAYLGSIWVGLAMVRRHLQCQERDCRRWGTHHAHGEHGPVRVCRPHHVQIVGHDSTLDDLIDSHQRHLANVRPRPPAVRAPRGGGKPAR